MIGAEFASVYTDLGVETTLLEAMNDGVLPIGPDRDVANVLAKSLAKRGTKIHAEARVGALQHTETGVIVPFETPKGSDKIERTRLDRPPREVEAPVGAAEPDVDAGLDAARAAEAGRAVVLGRGERQTMPISLAP